MKFTQFHTLKGRSTGYWGLLAALGLSVAFGLAAAHYMDTHGHHVTGMTNQVVWGMPHVFAVFLIVAASGALNVASIASVFDHVTYKPLSRLSGLLAITLLVGGLAVLVLDLGRPDRLIVAMTYYNFRSIFAWNIFLYIGFILVVAAYLCVMFERRLGSYTKPMGVVALVWRFVLTTGTGSIFGFLVARQAYDAAIMAPLFILMSLSFGTAVFMLVLLASCRGTGCVLGDNILGRLAKLLAIFVSAVLYLTLAYHLTNLYAAEHQGVERFILLDGTVYTWVFWLVQILLGGVVPLLLLLIRRFGHSRQAIGWSAVLVIVGGFGQLYVIIIGGQAYPLVLFPGLEVSSTFFDGVVAHYAPSLFEVALGIGGVCFALLATVLAMRVLPFLPESLADPNTAPGGTTAVMQPAGT